jgi:CRP/FNR family cyclic AMP-dependent transcriptional regulator
VVPDANVAAAGAIRQGSAEESVLSQITHDTLADVVGATRSRVNVFMNEFRKPGFMHYRRTGGLKIYQSFSRVLEE